MLLKEEDGSANLQERAPTPVAPIYYYHPDHLGTSTFLTDANGVAYQFFLNLPFGETMAEQYPNSYYKTPFKFSGKEMDEQTGLHYFGARYYDSQVSIWLSVDPLAESYPNFNPYNYTMQNPINLVDPTGMSPEGSYGGGDPPKKGWFQQLCDGLSSLFGSGMVHDANKLAASKGQDEQTADKLALHSRLAEGTTQSLEEGVQVIRDYVPNADEAYVGALFLSGQNDKPLPK